MPRFSSRLANGFIAIITFVAVSSPADGEQFVTYTDPCPSGAGSLEHTSNKPSTLNVLRDDTHMTHFCFRIALPKGAT